MNDDGTHNSQFYEFEENVQSNRSKSVHNPNSDKHNGENNNELEQRGPPLWSIEDDTLFEPCGLINHSSGINKSVFVTWNEEYVLNYRFKRSKKTKHVEMTKVRIPIPPNAGEILEIHILDFNTILLMSNGRIYYFSSVKSVQMLSWLDDVRCFARAAGGFSIIRYDVQSKRLLLEIYDDVINIGKSENTLRSSYDITYDDRNIFNCEWRDNKFTLHTYTVKSDDDVAFIKKLMSVNEINAGHELHIFTIDGRVFLLTSSNETTERMDVDMEPGKETYTPPYEIVLLCIYAVPVKQVKLLPHLNLCLVFLNSGSIDIWYISQLTQLKQRQIHHTGTEFIDFDATSPNGDFYYTNGDQLARLSFQYDSITDDCLVQEQFKYIEGMLACTWLQHLTQLVCLSANNIFYRIDFHVETKTNPEPNDDIYKLTDLTRSDIQRLQLKAKIVEEYQQLPEQLYAAIEREFQKQQLIAVASKSQLYSQLLIAELLFCLHLPAFQSGTVLFHTDSHRQMTSENYFALLKIKLKCTTDIFQTAPWQMFIYEDTKVIVMHNIPMDLLVNKTCIIVIPLSKHQNCCLPTFTLKLTSFLQIKSQIHAIILPVTVQETKSLYKGLFSHTTQELNIFAKPNLIDIINHYRQQQGLSLSPKEETINITHKFKLPVTCSLKNVMETFDIVNPIDDDDENVTELKLYFINNALDLSYVKATHSLQLTSMDATSIYYLKLHLLLNWSQLDSSDADNDDVQLVEEKPLEMENQAKCLQFIMKCQCEAERCYGSQNKTNLAEQLADNVYESHLDNLLNIYRKIRFELG